MKTKGTHNYFVYILTNYKKTVLYTGVTNNLTKRLYYHKNSKNSFTNRYKCYYLIYHEAFSNVEVAIKREKQIKGWKRVKKNELISAINPNWRFLNAEV